ncbi:flagellar hook-length control protein FliK [Gemmobacter serpentinus]|uniref:flagellar hook-length control protein FliK n=1 Tax=Gemmobacter serpentinus TaxID=2652247 RepID=UPI0018658151|nr:flagellar hook-length control protein FliK [Gemmobacter serpentinus]
MIDFSAFVPEAEDIPQDPAQGAPETPLYILAVASQTTDGDTADDVTGKAKPEATGRMQPPAPDAPPEPKVDRPPDPAAKTQTAISCDGGPQAPHHDETAELWRMVQNLRATARDAPQVLPQTQQNPAPADTPSMDLPALEGGAQEVVARIAPDVNSPGGIDPATLTAMTPRLVSDQILAALRPHLAVLAGQIPPPARPDTMAVIAAEPDRVEIRLDPQELGRVQITLETEGDSLRLMITVDRPETLDLLRRHADILAQSLQDSGFKGAQLDFSGGQKQDAPEGQVFDAPPTDQNAATPLAGAAALVSGLNLLM